MTRIKKFYWLEEKSNDPIREKNEYTTYSADINFTKKVSKVKPPIVDIDTKVYNIVETNKLIYDDNNIFDILSIDYSTESLNKFINNSKYYDILDKYIMLDEAKILYKITSSIDLNNIYGIIKKNKLVGIQITVDIDDNKIILYGSSKNVYSLFNFLGDYKLESKLIDLYDKIKLSVRELKKDTFDSYVLLNEFIKIYLRIGLFDYDIIDPEYKDIMIHDNTQYYFVIDITNYRYNRISTLLNYFSNSINVFYLSVFYID
jgi:hypothetical protein